MLKLAATNVAASFFLCICSGFKEVSVAAVSETDYWDINGTNLTKLTLTWENSSAIPSLPLVPNTRFDCLFYECAEICWLAAECFFDSV